MEKKYYIGFLLALCVAFSSSCKDREKSDFVSTEDVQAKMMLQGIWVDEEDGNVVMRVVGDTIYYPDHEAENVAFYVSADSIFLKTSKPTCYLVRVLTDRTFHFENSDGDEVNLMRSTDKADEKRFRASGAEQMHTAINQGRLIKRDSVLVYGEKRYHAYVQVNPTSYKILRQSMNDEGVIVDKAYYENIVHIALYDGGKKVFGRDFRKADFAKQVPDEYLQRSVLSDILIRNITSDGVEFMADICAPDDYTSYRVKIKVGENGTFSLTI